MNLTTQIELLRLLVDGCKYHPAYKGKHSPRVDCPECKAIYDARLLLTKENIL